MSEREPAPSVDAKNWTGEVSSFDKSLVPRWNGEASLLSRAALLMLASGVAVLSIGWSLGLIDAEIPRLGSRMALYGFAVLAGIALLIALLITLARWQARRLRPKYKWKRPAKSHADK